MNLYQPSIKLTKGQSVLEHSKDVIGAALGEKLIR